MAKQPKAGERAQFVAAQLAEEQKQKMTIRFRRSDVLGGYQNNPEKLQNKFTVPAICEVVYKEDGKPPRNRIAFYMPGSPTIWLDETEIKRNEIKQLKLQNIAFQGYEITMVRDSDPLLYDYLQVASFRGNSPHRKTSLPIHYDVVDKQARIIHDLERKKIITKTLSVWDDAVDVEKGKERTLDQQDKVSQAFAVASSLGIDIYRPFTEVVHDIRIFIERDPETWIKAMNNPVNACIFLVKEAVRAGIITENKPANTLLYKGQRNAYPQGADAVKGLATFLASEEGDTLFASIKEDVLEVWRNEHIGAPVLQPEAIQKVSADEHYKQLLAKIKSE